MRLDRLRNKSVAFPYSAIPTGLDSLCVWNCRCKTLRPIAELQQSYARKVIVMDELEFWSNAIEHLAWPSIAAYVVYTQKSAVGELIGRIKSVEGAGFKAELAERASDLKDQATELATKPVEAPKLEGRAVIGAHLQASGAAMATGSATLTRGEQVSASAGYSDTPGEDNVVRLSKWKLSSIVAKEPDERMRASGQIIEEWTNLENVIRLLAAEHGVKADSNAKFIEVLKGLMMKYVISDKTYELIRDLRQLRNQVAHSKIEPTRRSGEDYAATCRAVEKRLDNEDSAWHAAASHLD
jgi:hypothetical protein